MSTLSSSTWGHILTLSASILGFHETPGSWQELSFLFVVSQGEKLYTHTHTLDTEKQLFWPNFLWSTLLPMIDVTGHFICKTIQSILIQACTYWFKIFVIIYISVSIKYTYQPIYRCRKKFALMARDKVNLSKITKLSKLRKYTSSKS